MENLSKKIKLINLGYLIGTLSFIIISFIIAMKIIPFPINFCICIFIHLTSVIMMLKINQLHKKKIFQPYINAISTNDFNDALLERNYFALDRVEKIEVMATLATKYNTSVEVLLYKLQEIKKNEN